MIDWVSCTVDIDHDPISSGLLLLVSADGEQQAAYPRRVSERGSWDCSVQLLSIGSQLQIDGNLVRYVQGHNVDGPDNLRVVLSRFLRVALGLDLSAARSVVVRRVDVTYSFALESPADVESWLLAASDAGVLRHRGRGVYDRGTVYWGKHSRRWSLKMYAKGRELRSRRKSAKAVGQLRCWDELDRLVRVELVLRSLELRVMGNVLDVDFRAEWERRVSRLSLPESVPDERCVGRVGVMLAAWRRGVDLRSALSRSAWYRVRRDVLRSSGVDIAGEPVVAGAVLPVLRPVVAEPWHLSGRDREGWRVLLAG